MSWIVHKKGIMRGLALGCASLLLGSISAAVADEVETTSVHVLVKDAETQQPIQNARLTLQFRQPGSKLKLKRGKTISFSAKTNPQGRYRFLNIPKGTIRLMVTAERRQAFGKEFELEKDNQLFEVMLKRPQPLL